jgi:hypothetical protein
MRGEISLVSPQARISIFASFFEHCGRVDAVFLGLAQRFGSLVGWAAQLMQQLPQMREAVQCFDKSAIRRLIHFGKLAVAAQRQAISDRYPQHV